MPFSPRKLTRFYEKLMCLIQNSKGHQGVHEFTVVRETDRVDAHTIHLHQNSYISALLSVFPTAAASTASDSGSRYRIY